MNLIAPLSEDQWPLMRRCDTIARFWNLHWSAIQLTILREKGERDLADFKFSILRRHQRSYFLEGLKKLGIDRSLPPAVVAGRYHYLSNMLGGLPMEYVEESPRKVWIRYLPPAWSFAGSSLFAVPSSVQRAMFAGWHPYNGESLGCLRLGFVVTKVFQDGEPYDEGYFLEYDRELAPDERIQFRPVTVSPDFDPARAPTLDPAVWPKERLWRAKRNFAQGYVENAIRTALEMYGVHKAAAFIAQAARLCAVQYFNEFRDLLRIRGSKAADFVQMFGLLCQLAGEEVSVVEKGPDRFELKRANRICATEDIAPEIYQALFAFEQVGAKILSPRVRVSLSSLEVARGAREEWTVEDVKNRLF